MTKPASLSWPKLRELGVEASVDPRTVKAVYEGRTVRGGAGERARAVLVKHGYLKPESAEQGAPASGAGA